MNRAIEETLRDIKVARSDLAGRRDQVVAEFDDRAASLERIGEDLNSGKIEARAAQAQIRRILGDRGAAKRGVTAGRTKIGMTVPTASSPQPMGKSPSRSGGGSTPAKVELTVGRALSEVDSRVGALLEGRRSDEARLELSLLGQLRRSLALHSSDLPRDAVLLESVVDFTEHASAALGDLRAGGTQRLQRLLEHDRLLVSQLSALGGAVAEIKETVTRARALLGEPDAKLETALEQALQAFVQLQAEIDRHLGPTPRSWFDEILGPVK